jgi:hypothetical protein
VLSRLDANTKPVAGSSAAGTLAIAVSSSISTTVPSGL